jgi:hypothetical protein
MSKQDIEKRLGFAAQGVKETTRTSAKAAFASPKYRAFVYRGSPSNSVLVKATEWMDSASAAEDAAKQIVMSFRGKPGYPSNNYFADIAQETPEGAKTVKNNIRFSRPGVKAEFVRFMDLETWKNSKGTVFTAGIEEDSGNRFTPYVTSRDSSGGLQLRTLSAPTFKTEKGARKWLNTWMQSNKSTSSRPGVKANMGLEMNMLDFRHKFFTAFGTAIRDAKSNPNTAEAQSDETVLRESWASMFAQGYSDAISDLNGLSATMKSKTSVGQMRKAASDAMETYRQAKADVRASRPGVKAKFEKEYVLWGLPKGETDAIHQQVLSTQAKTPAQMEDVKKRAAAAGWHSFRVQILDLSKPYKGFARPSAKAKA